MSNYEIINKTNYEYDKKIIDKVIKRALKVENVNKASFSIVLIPDDEMHKMNKMYRNIDRSTDVLSFAFEDNEKIVYNIRQLGEIFVNVKAVKEQALEYGHSEKRELAFLIVHGLLHLLGYDHTLGPKEEKEMFERQELILNEFEETRRA